MKHVKFLFVVCFCILISTVARADDGGFLDWLYRLDPKLGGVGSEIHVLCLDDNKERVHGCEQWWWGLRQAIRGKEPSPYPSAYPISVLDKTRHEFDFRFAFYWK